MINESNEDIVREFYRRFTDGEREQMFELLADDVEWVNEPKDIHTRGQDELKALWARQGAAAKVEIKPVRFTLIPHGVLVEIAEKVWIDDKLVFEGPVGHKYQLSNDKIRRCDIVDV